MTLVSGNYTKTTDYVVHMGKPAAKEFKTK